MSLIQYLRRRIISKHHIPSVIKHYKYKTIAEVGVYVGVFFQKLIAPPSVFKAYAVDLWEKYPQSDIGGHFTWDFTVPTLTKLRLDFQAKYKDDRRVIIRHMSSVEAASTIPDGELDLCFIDAGHDYASIHADLYAWWPKVRRGGLICGHDYRNPKWGVRTAVDEYVQKWHLLRRFHSFEYSGGCWFIVR
jgi:hypothetical protein